jgi:hypothetical protein
MTIMIRHLTCILGSMLLATAAMGAQAAEMSFFVTSVGLGNGADLSGLAGADKHCQALAAKAGAGNRTWRAYLSTQAANGTKAENARERIGNGPWHNAKGVAIAKSVEDLHGDSNNLTKETALSEKGEVINGRGDKPNRHDMLTGSLPDGRAPTGEKNMTCGNWTQSGEGAALVGHHDRMGLRDDAASKSWNSSHPSRGCSQEALRSSGGDGLLYCFAVK